MSIYLNNTATIDTGLHTGIAIWNGTAFPLVHEIACPTNKKYTLERKLCYMSDSLQYFLKSFSLSKVYIEGVELWGDSDKSQQAAKRGNLFFLAYMVGVYCQLCINRTIQFEIITARQWKGQLTKEGTAMRVKAINGKEYLSEHITDSVAFGFSRNQDLWQLKHLRKIKKEVV